MTDEASSLENGSEEGVVVKLPETEKGFHPESTKEIIDNLTPKAEKKPSSLLGFLKSNARRLAPIVLLAASIGGGAKMYQGGGGNGGGESEFVSISGEISPQAQAELDYFQKTSKEEFATIKNENLKPLNYMEKGVVLGFDEKGNVKQNGTIDVKAFAGDKYSDGTQVDTIAKLPIGTKIEGGILKTGSARQEDKVQQYLEFSCDSVQGDFHDPKVEEKIIQLDENTICVVPWMNVAGQ